MTRLTTLLTVLLIAGCGGSDATPSGESVAGATVAPAGGAPQAVGVSASAPKARKARKLSKKLDRDRDRLPDNWERRHRLKVGKKDAKLDPDRDRVSNLAEYLRGTHPRKADRGRTGKPADDGLDPGEDEELTIEELDEDGETPPDDLGEDSPGEDAGEDGP